MVTTYDVSELKNQLPAQVMQGVRRGHAASFLKNGKVLFMGVNPEEYEEFQKIKAREEHAKKVREWEDSLPVMEITEEERISIAEARDEMENRKEFRKVGSISEAMELISSSDEDTPIIVG